MEALKRGKTVGVRLIRLAHKGLSFERLGQILSGWAALTDQGLGDSALVIDMKIEF
jgi:hypothetical protein